MKRILIASDKFKDALTARSACAAIARGLGDAGIGAELDLCPLTDGGEGFAEILSGAVGGERSELRVRNARGREVDASVGWVTQVQIPVAARDQLALPVMSHEERIAIVSMASCSGLEQLLPNERNPWRASSSGTGEALCHARSRGARAILLGIGGSATHDLGLGALSAMGWKFFDATGRIIEWPCPRVWRDIVRIEKSGDGEWPPIRIACDVDNPLLGERGAARVYAGQKGLAMIDTDELEALTSELARRCCASAQVDFELITRPGMGAAGGIAVGLGSMLGAQLVPGSSLVSDWLSIRLRIEAADIVITGEGCFDRSSLEGKGPGAVLRYARQLGKSVHVFAGASKVSVKEGVALHVITPAGQPLGDALTECAKNLRHSVARVFADVRAASD